MVSEIPDLVNLIAGAAQLVINNPNATTIEVHTIQHTHMLKLRFAHSFAHSGLIGYC